jgi:hypothetical protein
MEGDDYSHRNSDTRAQRGAAQRAQRKIFEQEGTEETERAD